MVEVHLYGKLRRFAPVSDPTADSVVSANRRDGDTIRDVLSRIGVPLREVGANVFLNGEYSGLTREVRDGDRLGVFPDDMQLLYRWYFRKQEGDVACRDGHRGSSPRVPGERPTGAPGR